MPAACYVGHAGLVELDAEADKLRTALGAMTSPRTLSLDAEPGRQSLVRESARACSYCS